jgi:hypothetical protein
MQTVCHPSQQEYGTNKNWETLKAEGGKCPQGGYFEQITNDDGVRHDYKSLGSKSQLEHASTFDKPDPSAQNINLQDEIEN